MIAEERMSLAHQGEIHMCGDYEQPGECGSRVVFFVIQADAEDAGASSSSCFVDARSMSSVD